MDSEGSHGVGAAVDAVGQFEQGVDEAAGIRSAGQNGVARAELAGDEAEGFGGARHRGARLLQKVDGHWGVRSGGKDAEVAGGSLVGGRGARDGDAPFGQDAPADSEVRARCRPRTAPAQRGALVTHGSPQRPFVLDLLLE